MPQLPSELHEIVAVAIAVFTIGVSVLMLVCNVRRLMRTSISRLRSAWIGRLQTAFEDFGTARYKGRRNR
jgi:hypothetical protein